MSVLGEASVYRARECQHVYNWPASTPMLSTASTFSTQGEVGWFLGERIES